MKCEEVIAELKKQANPESVTGMAKFGINPENTLGVAIPFLRTLARKIKKNHALAQCLWETGIHEARILATMVADATQVNEELMEKWVLDFDSWDICDQCCSNLFRHTEFAYPKAIEWSARTEKFVKRAAFAMMAALAVGDKKAEDSCFESFLPIIIREAGDDRNYVRKAVNWALRQVGKRNRNLNVKALATARVIQQLDAKSARWIAADAIRELTSEPVLRRLKN